MKDIVCQFCHESKDKQHIQSKCSLLIWYEKTQSLSLQTWPEYLTFSRKLKKLDRFRVLRVVALRTIHLWFHWYDRQVMKELNNANLCSFIYSWTRTWQLDKLIIDEIIFFQCSWLLMFSIFSSAYFVVSGLDKNLLESWFNGRFKMIKCIYIMVIRG